MNLGYFCCDMFVVGQGVWCDLSLTILHDGRVVISKIFVHVYPHNLKKNDPIWLTVQPPNTKMTMENPTTRFPASHVNFRGCIFFTKGCLNYQPDLSGFGYQVGYQLVVKVNILDVFLLGACFTDCTMVNHHLNPSKQANQRNRLPAGCPKVSSCKPVEVGNLSPCLHGFIHPRWCRTSSINSITGSSGSLI